uniref:Pseudouridylate synthase 7 homolog-like protein n=1 Tax=Phallusia mammillata TaxID=59560 RepID=A0A6F9DPE5_9ASCI|nr:pseudouridylate synthase 7 homolog-like protein [Phallusia mammillata]
MTVEGINSASLTKLSTKLPENLRVYDVTETSSHIQRGQLAGNRFSITIRNVRELSPERSAYDATMSDELYSLQLKQLIHDSISHIETKGFINYFGPQRFGRQLSEVIDRSVNATYEASSIGLAILKKDFKKSVEILLRPNDFSDKCDKLSKVDEAKRLFQETGDIEGTLALMPKHKSREVAVLRALRRFRSDVTKPNRKRRHEDSNTPTTQDKNVIGVTSSTKENVQCVTMRVDDVKVPMTSLINDVTKQDAYMKALLSLPHSAIMLYVHAYCSHVWNHVADDRVRRYGYRVVEGDLVQSDSGVLSRDQVHVVTPHDVANKSFAPSDIVLPLPGNKVTNPPNLAETYHKLLTADGIDTSPQGGAFNVNQLKVRVPGTNRKLFQFPSNVSFNLKRSDDRIQLDSTDDTDVVGSNPTRDGCDVKVNFDLPSSCYATSVLRELSHGGVASW